MTKHGSKVAILHDDLEVNERVTAVATRAGLHVVRPQTFSWIDNEIADPTLAAVVIDLVGPRGGDFEAIERLTKRSAGARVIAITSLDVKTVDSTQRLAQSKGFTLTILRKDSMTDQSILQHLGAAEATATFGADDLREALERRLVRVEYQPKVPLGGTTAAAEYGVEALCRITHPRFGTISPDMFIPLAEQHGMMLQLTDAVVCQAFGDQRAWRQEGLSVRMAVNISPELLKDGEWCDLFLRRCAEYEVEAEQVTLEITESSSGAAHPTALDILTRLRLKGFTLSIDDFGTGFSSLATLYKLPFGELKIDKSFILDLQKSAEARALIESTVSMAQKIGVKVVAEGVESEAIFRELRLIGCHEAQGFFVGKSMPPERIQKFFADWSAMTKSQSIHAGTPSALPKIAMIQVLLNDILNDRSVDVDSTLVLADFDKAKAMEGGFREDSTLDLARKIPPLVLQGKTAEALANCHAAAQRLEISDSRESLKSKIAQLQSLLEQELVTTSDLELAGAHGIARLLPRSSATLGRPSSGANVDIPVKCRWFSRGEKNLRIFSKGADWFVEDRGSTNGNFIGGQKLEPKRPIPLVLGETVVTTGQQGSIAPLSIRLRRSEANPGAVVITFEFDEKAVRDSTEQELWPALQRDLTTTWVVFDGVISAGRSEECALVLDDCEADQAAHIRFRNGYWISPAAGTELTLGDAIFCREVPIPPKAELALAGALLTVQEAPKEDALPAASHASGAIAARGQG